MDIYLEHQKINLIKLILSLHDGKVLDEIENLITSKIETSDEIFFSVDDYKKHIYEIQKEVQEGKYIEHNVLVSEIADE